MVLSGTPHVKVAKVAPRSLDRLLYTLGRPTAVLNVYRCAKGWIDFVPNILASSGSSGAQTHTLADIADIRDSFE